MGKLLKIAVPTVNRLLTPHFGHCEKFAIVHVEDNEIIHEEYLDPPAHQPGVYPSFLASRGVNMIITGGMGRRAIDLFVSNNIEVCMGVAGGSPKDIVNDLLNNRLQTGENLCDH